jgi:hypothetical protein
MHDRCQSLLYISRTRRSPRYRPDLGRYVSITIGPASLSLLLECHWLGRHDSIQAGSIRRSVGQRQRRNGKSKPDWLDEDSPRKYPGRVIARSLAVNLGQIHIRRTTPFIVCPFDLCFRCRTLIFLIMILWAYKSPLTVQLVPACSKEFDLPGSHRVLLSWHGYCPRLDICGCHSSFRSC